ncbi:MAG: iron-containing alcohol dehydrogenase [Ignavibacteriaceae bacterium]|jgi:alcohol dehydrogenase|nr:iron-containing alcohol dehydrogenase [Ignavibacteriaceae bacterium]
MPGTYHIPSTNLIEPGCIKKTGEWTKILGGTIALIVTSPDEYGKKLGGMIEDILTADGIKSHLYSGAGSNPTDEMVMLGAEEFNNYKCDIIIAIGGGSAIDCAKGIALAARSGKNIIEFEGVNKSQNNVPPLIAVNTTSGTGSEVSSFTVISESASGRKMTIVDWRITPAVSINDAELALSMPQSLTAATGMDAFSHAIEAIVSNNSTPITDALSFEAIQLINEWLRAAYEDGKNLKARVEMCHGAFLAGIAFNNSGLGLVHALSHPVTSMYGFPHGVVNSVLLPAVIKFNMVSSLSKYARVAFAMKVAIPWHSENENAQKVVPAVVQLIKKLGMPAGLKELGVIKDDIPELAKAANEEIVGRTNPRKANVMMINQIYNDAMYLPKVQPF